MKNHVTDLEWSKKLKEMGFPHKPLFGDGFIATELSEELPDGILHKETRWTMVGMV